MVDKIFLNKLGLVDTFMHRFGYVRTKVEHINTVLSKVFIIAEYTNNSINRRINIDCNQLQDSNIIVGMTMYKIPKEKTFFSLFDFLDARKLNERIQSQLPDGGDFETFIKQYFEDLQLLFENELNDQITGKSFEDHWDLLNQSFDEHGDVFYEMEKSVVEEYKKKMDN